MQSGHHLLGTLDGGVGCAVPEPPATSVLGALRLAGQAVHLGLGGVEGVLGGGPGVVEAVKQCVNE
jgi:hypothetical protein